MKKISFILFIAIFIFLGSQVSFSFECAPNECTPACGSTCDYFLCEDANENDSVFTIPLFYFTSVGCDADSLVRKDTLPFFLDDSPTANQYPMLPEHDATFPSKVCNRYTNTGSACTCSLQIYPTGNSCGDIILPGGHAGGTPYSTACPAGCVGTVTADCDSSGIWINQSDDCVVGATCAAEVYTTDNGCGDITLPAGQAASTSYSTGCPGACVGTVSADCDAGGIWTNHDNTCVVPVPAFNCTGAVPGNSTICSGDDSGLSADTPRTVVDFCTVATKCEYTCNAGHANSGGVCVPVVFNCTGADPGDASICAGDNLGLSADTPKSLVAACTLPIKCEYTCDSGFILSGGVCVATPVDGICDNSIRNGCTAGTANDPAYPDTATEYLWQCDGINGGTDSVMCSFPIPAGPVDGVCNESDQNGCTAGTLNDLPDTPTDYRWQCDGINGGSNSDVCEMTIPCECEFLAGGGVGCAVDCGSAGTCADGEFCDHYTCNRPGCADEWQCESSSGCACTADTINDCAMGLGFPGDTDGTCTNGTTGTCEYQCNEGSTGFWSENSNNCVVPPSDCNGVCYGGSPVDCCYQDGVANAIPHGTTVDGSCEEAGWCKISCDDGDRTVDHHCKPAAPPDCLLTYTNSSGSTQCTVDGSPGDFFHGGSKTGSCAEASTGGLGTPSSCSATCTSGSISSWNNNCCSNYVTNDICNEFPCSATHKKYTRSCAGEGSTSECRLDSNCNCLSSGSLCGACAPGACPGGGTCGALCCSGSGSCLSDGGGNLCWVCD